MEIEISDKKVAVAMSGGVDSSLTAAILKNAGYEVYGFMLQTWKDPVYDKMLADPFQSAREVAAALNIPFEIIDVRKEFKDEVVEPFIQWYQNGLTPSPCVFCNRKIKWNYMLKAADSIGAKYVATGHYARITQDHEGLSELRMGRDGSKDQAYMLCQLTQSELSRTLFPLGELEKKEVRKMAAEMSVPSAHREDSQDLCFLPDGDYRSFLLRMSPGSIKRGDILDSQGRKVGEHQGLAFYTIGQRKGLGVFRADPVFVLEKDSINNTIIVGPLEELGKKTMQVNDINWISGQEVVEPLQAEVKIRYRANFASGTIFPIGKSSANVIFEKPLRDITPGQIAVFYRGDQVLGGGVIRA